MIRPTTRIVVVMVLWAACYPLVTLGLDFSPHLTFAALRAFIAAAALLALAAVLRRSPPTNPRTWVWLCIAGLGSTTFGFLGMFHAAEFLSPGLATVIASTQPLIAAVLAHFVLYERLGARANLGLLVGFAGVIVAASPQIIGGHADATIKGVSYILLAAAGMSVGNVAIKKLAGVLDPSVAMGCQLLIGALPLAILAGLTENPGSLRWNVDFVLSLLGLSVFGTAIAFLWWQRALAETDLSRANAFSFLVPFLGLAFGFVFFEEDIYGLAVVGAIAAVFGVRLVTARPPQAPTVIPFQTNDHARRIDHERRL